MNKNRVWIIVWGAIIVLILIGGVFYWQQQKAQQSPQEPYYYTNPQTGRQSYVNPQEPVDPNSPQHLSLLNTEVVGPTLTSYQLENLRAKIEFYVHTKINKSIVTAAIVSNSVKILPGGQGATFLIQAGSNTPPLAVSEQPTNYYVLNVVVNGITIPEPDATAN